MGLTARGLTLACGVCGQRGLFRHLGMYGMVDECPRCGLRFERKEGTSLGAVVVNTAVSAALVLIALGIAMATLGTDTSRLTLLAIVAPFGTIFPILFDPFSRTIWLAIDLAMSPAGPDEVDPRWARTVDKQPFLNGDETHLDQAR